MYSEFKILPKTFASYTSRGSKQDVIAYGMFFKIIRSRILHDGKTS